MPRENRTEKVELEKRIHEVSLLLRRKSTKFIIEYILDTWDVTSAQAYNYIRLAREEWKKYFLNLKNAGMSYHVSQLRELKDQAYEKKVVIGSGDNKKTVTIADLGLIFEIAKEESKLMGLYPSEKHKVEVEEVGELVDAKRKLIGKLNALEDKRAEGADNK